MMPLTSKPKVDAMLPRPSVDDRLGALYGTWIERNDIIATLVRLLGFIAFVASKLTMVDRRNLALALREVAQHVETQPAMELVS